MLPTEKHPLWELLSELTLALMFATGAAVSSQFLHVLPWLLPLPKPLAPSPVSAFPFSCWPLVWSDGVSINIATKHRQRILVAGEVIAKPFVLLYKLGASSKHQACAAGCEHLLPGCRWCESHRRWNTAGVGTWASAAHRHRCRLQSGCMCPQQPALEGG